jgi:hypothetical protein
MGWITQTRWRAVGAVTTACAAGMAWYGAASRFFVESLVQFILYWGVFLALLVISLFIVALDIRYTILQYRLSERELFHETLGDEQFRKTLIAAQQRDRKPSDRA